MVHTSMSSARSEIIYSTPTKALFSNENSHNGHDAVASAKERFSKRSRIATPLASSCNDNRSDCGATDYQSWKQVREERSHVSKTEVGSEVNSCAASSVVSVSQMRGWLNDFGEQNKAHFDKTNSIGKQPQGISLSKPHRPKAASSTQQTAMVVVKNLTSTHDSTQGPARTPVRFKPRFKQTDVEATNDGYASVQKLSAWLADDPTSAKKVTHVRKGINVITKSRAFEKDTMTDIIIEENAIKKGSVTEKKRAIQCQNDGGSEAGGGDYGTTPSVEDKKKWLQSAFQKQPRSAEEKSDISVMSSVMSVSDKKKWLQSAFAKMDNNENSKHSLTDKASKTARSQASTKAEKDSALDQSRDESIATRDEISSSNPIQSSEDIDQSRPEKGTTSFAERNSSENSNPSVNDKVQRSALPLVSNEMKQGDAQKDLRDNCVVGRNRGRVNLALSRKEREQFGTGGGMTEQVDKSNDVLEHTQTLVRSLLKEGAHRDDDKEEESFGFQAARQKLVKRSEKNGSSVSVLSKVQLRKQKFEKLGKERVRGAGPKGLLKPSWESGENLEGQSSTSYSKTFIEDVAPKRSFEELP